MTEATLIRKLKQERTLCEQRAVTLDASWYLAQSSAFAQAIRIVRAAYSAERKRSRK